MNLGYKILGGIAVGLGLTLTSLACIVERSYMPVEATDLGTESRANIIIQGTPFSLRKDGSFLIAVNGENFFVERGFNHEINGLGGSKGDYQNAVSALEKEISDSDQEKIRVMGDYTGDKTIKAKHLEIEGALYPVYQ